jgi:hypothetical protein
MSTAPWTRSTNTGSRFYDFIKCRSLVTGSMAQIKPLKLVSRLQISAFIANPIAEAAGSGRGRHWLALAAALRGRAQWVTGVRVFLSHGGQFSMRFATTGSQQREECVYANLNRRRAAMKPGNVEAAWPVLVDGEGSLL